MGFFYVFKGQQLLRDGRALIKPFPKCTLITNSRELKDTYDVEMPRNIARKSPALADLAVLDSL